MMMWAKPAAYNADHGGGWSLQPSGESWYNAYVDIGNSSANATIEIALNASGSSTSPASPDIVRGLKARIKTAPVDGKSKESAYQIVCVNNSLKTIGSVTNKITTKLTLSGKTFVGEVEAGVAFESLHSPGPAYWEADCKNTAGVNVLRP